MNLYEIDQQIQEILSQTNDDGMLPDDAFEALEQLAITEAEKIENVACFIKDQIAEGKALREEEKALADRRKVKENKAERLKTYLSDYLQAKGMKKYETPRAVMSFRKSVKTEVNEADLEDSLFVITRKPDVAHIKKLLQDGVEVPGASLIENQNIQIR